MREQIRHVEEDPSLSPPNRELADALANFSMGILRDAALDEEALTNYSKAIELAPDAIQAYIGIATHHIRRGEADQAIAIMEEYCARNPESVTARLYLAQVCQSLDRPDLAIEASRKAAELAPDDYRPYARLASVHARQEEHAQAIDVLKDALNKVEKPLPLLRYLGDLHAQKINLSDSKQQAATHIKEAIRYYSKAAELPHDKLTHAYLRRLGDMHLMNQDVEQAIHVFEELSVHLPNDIQLHKKLALCYMSVNDKDNAVRALRKVSDGIPDNVELYCYLGELYEASGDIENAIQCYEKAAALPGENPLPYLRLANLYLNTEPEQAFEILEDALEQIPGNIELLSLLARARLVRQQNLEAIAAFEELLERLKTKGMPMPGADFFLDFGLAAQQLELTDKASAFYEQGLELNPSSAELSIRLSFLRMNQDRMDDAIKIMEGAASTLPAEPDLHYYLGLLYLQAERFEEAVQSFRKVHEIARRTPQVTLDAAFFFNYGAAFERVDDHESAETMLLKAISLDPGHAAALNYVAYMWAELDVNLDLALEYVTHALDLDPHNGAFIDTLGWVYYKKGEYKLAKDHIENALFFMPDDSVIAKHMGDVLYALGREEDAMNWWTYSFGLDPCNEKSRERLVSRGIDPKELLLDLTPEEP